MGLAVHIDVSWIAAPCLRARGIPQERFSGPLSLWTVMDHASLSAASSSQQRGALTQAQHLQTGREAFHRCQRSSLSHTQEATVVSQPEALRFQWASPQPGSFGCLWGNCPTTHMCQSAERPKGQEDSAYSPDLNPLMAHRGLKVMQGIKQTFW